MVHLAKLVVAAATWSLAAAHTVLVYPPWRGDNIHTNGTMSDTDPSIPPGSLGINYNKTSDTYGFPFGMQWMYPCTWRNLSFYSLWQVYAHIADTKTLQAAACPRRGTAQNGR